MAGGIWLTAKHKHTHTREIGKIFNASSFLLVIASSASRLVGSDWAPLSDKLTVWGPLGQPALHAHLLPTKARQTVILSGVTDAADRTGGRTKAVKFRYL